MLAGLGAEQICGLVASGMCLTQGARSVGEVVFGQRVKGKEVEALLCALNSLKVHLQ